MRTNALTEKEVLDRVHEAYHDQIQITSSYTRMKDHVMAHCNRCGHDFLTTPSSLLYKHHGCPYCAARSQTSFLEQFLFELCTRYFGDSKVLSRDHSLTGYELDIVILNDKNRPIYALEPGCWKWHKTPKRIKRDSEKRSACIENKVQLLTIYDNDVDHDAATSDDVWSYDYSFSDADPKHLLDLVRRINDHFKIKLSCIDIDASIRSAFTHMNGLSLQDLKEDLRGRHIDVLSTCLGTSHDHVRVKCDICGHIWDARIDTLSEHVHGCPVCGKKHMQLAQSKTVRQVETGIVYAGVRAASRQCHINHSHIVDCCNGKRKTAGGFHWEYCTAA